MWDIQLPDLNLHPAYPDHVLAQTVAADSAWQQDSDGIYDATGNLLARDLDGLGQKMRALGWFVPRCAASNGVAWKKVPHEVEARSLALR